MMVVVLYQKQSLTQEGHQNVDDDTLFEQLEVYTERIELGHQQLINQLKEHIEAKQQQINNLHTEVKQLKQAIASSATVEVSQKNDTPLDSPTQLEISLDEEAEEKALKEGLEQDKLVKHKQALDLSNQGFTAEKIAQILNLGKGEVQLLLNLQKRNK